VYTTPQDVRDILGIGVEDASDALLEEFIEKAQSVVIHYWQIPVLEEEPQIDTTGHTLVLSHPFLADTNFDKKIDGSDVVVYGYREIDNLETRETLAVSTIWPEKGVIKLVDNALGYSKVTVSYSYYTCAIDWNLVSLATTYYAAMLFVARELFLVPDDFTIGNIKVRQRQPWERLRQEFLRIVYHLTELPMDISAYRKIVRPARSGIRLVGPESSLEHELQEGDE